MSSRNSTSAHLLPSSGTTATTATTATHCHPQLLPWRSQVRASGLPGHLPAHTLFLWDSRLHSQVGMESPILASQVLGCGHTHAWRVAVERFYSASCQYGVLCGWALQTSPRDICYYTCVQLNELGIFKVVVSGDLPSRAERHCTCPLSLPE